MIQNRLLFLEMLNAQKKKPYEICYYNKFMSS